MNTLPEISLDLMNLIHQNHNNDPYSLLLSTKREFSKQQMDFALLQIISRKKYAGKLKNFLECRNFIFPDAISGEQASHQAVAKFHASLISEKSKILDITAGLGIDAMTFAFNNKVTAVDMDPVKCSALKLNVENLNIANLKICNADALKFLEETDESFDVIFTDPSRRDNSNQKVFLFKDCSPDIVSNQKIILSHTKLLYIKASPLIDLSQVMKELENIETIFVIGVKGECKEILIKISAKETDKTKSIEIKAVDLDNEGNILYEFNTVSNQIAGNSDISFAETEDLKIDSYILEPSAMIMKVAPWTQLCQTFQAKKFDPNTHLFITDYLPINFPGRVTRLKQCINKKDRKSLFRFPASAVSKNHPLSSDDLKKYFSLKEGDKNFIYGARLKGKPHIFLTESLQSS